MYKKSEKSILIEDPGAVYSNLLSCITCYKEYIVIAKVNKEYLTKCSNCNTIIIFIKKTDQSNNIQYIMKNANEKQIKQYVIQTLMEET